MDERLVRPGVRVATTSPEYFASKQGVIVAPDDERIQADRPGFTLAPPSGSTTWVLLDEPTSADPAGSTEFRSWKFYIETLEVLAPTDEEMQAAVRSILDSRPSEATD